MFFKFKYFLMVFFIFSCKSESKENKQNLKIVIDTLNTQASKEQFLLEVFNRDQYIRNPRFEKKILEKTNYNRESSEYKNYLNQIFYIDSLNFRLVQYYLKKHGYPDFKFNNALAEYAIIAVARHQNPANKMKLLPCLKKAYNSGSLKAEHFYEFLNEIYMDKYHKIYKSKGRTYEENIEIMTNRLQIY